MKPDYKNWIPKRKENSTNGRAGTDAPLTLSYQVVFCKDRLEYRQGQGGEQKERCQYAKWYTPEKETKYPDLLQGGFCRAAV